MVSEGPSPVRVEQKCQVNNYSVAISASIPVESIALGAGAKGTGSFRKLHRLACQHCIGERYSYSRGTPEECKEGSWECSHVVVDLTGLDAGEPIAFDDVASSTARIVEQPDRVASAIATIIEHLDDPERYTYLDKPKTRALAKKAEASLHELTSKAEGITFIEIPTGLISVNGDKLELVTADNVLSHGVATCRGITPDAS